MNTNLTEEEIKEFDVAFSVNQYQFWQSTNPKEVKDFISSLKSKWLTEYKSEILKKIDEAKSNVGGIENETKTAEQHGVLSGLEYAKKIIEGE